MTLNRLNAVQLIRIYGRYYNDPTTPKERDIKGQPVWSGHFYNGRQVFWGYHWLIRANGEAIKLLDDDKIGWHAGDWDVNRRSVAVCFDDDLDNKEPSKAALKSTKEIIKYYEPKAELIGHKDAKPTTTCPGALFSSWKAKLS
jgi:N-acetyl-anhydromuramyl-L-alanine amidase AmpD